MIFRPIKHQPTPWPKGKTQQRLETELEARMLEKRILDYLEHMKDTWQEKPKQGYVVIRCIESQDDGA